MSTTNPETAWTTGWTFPVLAIAILIALVTVLFPHSAVTSWVGRSSTSTALAATSPDAPAQLHSSASGNILIGEQPAFRLAFQWGDIRPEEPQVLYRIVDADGRTVQEGELPFRSTLPSLGGYVELTPDVPPGWYEVSMTVKDAAQPDRLVPLVNPSRPDRRPVVAFTRLAALPPTAGSTGTAGDASPAGWPAGGAALLAQTNLLAPVVRSTLGVNIHFGGAPDAHVQPLSILGVRWIRQDFTWSRIETKRGEYDFSSYDEQVAGLAKYGIFPLFILDYGNSLYQDGAPRSAEARAAFVRFAVAAVAHYRQYPVIWEIWNEPNIHFWQPRPDAQEYATLAVETARAIKAAYPDAVVVAPGTSGIDLGFIETCFRTGLLQYVDGVSVHPYRNTAPETAADDYRKLRELITRYAPAGKGVPILSSEWGYTATNVSEREQPKYLVRMWLTNLAAGIPLSIWYDWINDGTDPKEGEHNFGLLYPDFTPKPAFAAAATLVRTLGGLRFDRRLAWSNSDDYGLLFTGPNGAASLVAWTTAASSTASATSTGSTHNAGGNSGVAGTAGSSRLLHIDSARPLTVLDLFGRSTLLQPKDGQVNIPLSNSPVYIQLRQPDEDGELPPTEVTG